MPSNFNPMQLLGMMRKSGNPQQFMLNMLQETGSTNPLMANILNLAKQNNTAGIEQIARNICQERGLDFDKEFQAFKNQLGL